MAAVPEAETPGPAPDEQMAGPAPRRSRLWRNLAIVVILGILLAVFFLAPFVPFTKTYTDPAVPASISDTVKVSPSYFLFKCGEVSGGTSTMIIGGYTETVNVTAIGWVC